MRNQLDYMDYNSRQRPPKQRPSKQRPKHILKHLLIFVTMLAWALWLGGTIATFVFGFYFFKVLPHDNAAESANAMFHAFTPYELSLAGIAVLGSGLLMVTYPSKGFVLLLGTLVLAGAMAITVTLGLMPIMDSLHNEGRQAEFVKVHVKSMIAMTMQSAVLLLSGAILLGSVGSAEQAATRFASDNEMEKEPAY